MPNTIYVNRQVRKFDGACLEFALEIREFYDRSRAKAQREALAHAEGGGFVASLPHFVGWQAQDPGSEYFRRDLRIFNTASEEGVGIDRKGVVSPKAPLYFFANGNAGIIIRSPDRIAQARHAHTLLHDGHVKYSDDDISLILSGHDGTYPVYDAHAFFEDSRVPGFLASHPDYVVYAPFNRISILTSGAQPLRNLRRSFLFRIRVGGFNRANEFIDAASQVHVSSFVNRNPFEHVNPGNAQAAALYFGGYLYNNFPGSDLRDSSDGYYLSVSPQALAEFKRLEELVAGFEKNECRKMRQ